MLQFALDNDILFEDFTQVKLWTIRLFTWSCWQTWEKQMRDVKDVYQVDVPPLLSKQVTESKIIDQDT